MTAEEREKRAKEERRNRGKGKKKKRIAWHRNGKKQFGAGGLRPMQNRGKGRGGAGEEMQAQTPAEKRKKWGEGLSFISEGERKRTPLIRQGKEKFCKKGYPFREVTLIITLRKKEESKIQRGGNEERRRLLKPPSTKKEGREPHFNALVGEKKRKGGRAQSEREMDN